MRHWLAHDLRDTVADVLLASDSRVAALGNAQAVRRLVTQSDDFAGNHERVVWSLLMLELFLRAPSARGVPTSP